MTLIIIPTCLSTYVSICLSVYLGINVYLSNIYLSLSAFKIYVSIHVQSLHLCENKHEFY